MLSVFTMSELPSVAFVPFEACKFSIPQASPALPHSGLLDTALKLLLYCIPFCCQAKGRTWGRQCLYLHFAGHRAEA